MDTPPSDGERDLHLDAMIQELIQQGTFLLPDDSVHWLLEEIAPVLLRDPTVLDLTGPINVCGDIHGQFSDLLRIFQCGHFTPSTRYLFLGDYVDRGNQSLEVICLLFAMKLRYPLNIFLLRGNHESPEMTESFGFADECQMKLEPDLYAEFLRVFCCLPIAAVINGAVFCVHGGLSPVMTSIAEIRAIERPADIPEEGLLADLLWSDPSSETEDWGPNSRGETFTWGIVAARRFMEANGISVVIRAHQVASGGYDFPFEPNRSVVTVFSASAYANRYTNSAAFVTISETSELEFTVLPPVEEPVSDEMLEAIGTARDPFLEPVSSELYWR
jgi:serine/threonine-protein phosphatase PP1 catalytic subunit